MGPPPSEREAPDVSFVMPCYNEEDVIGSTVPALVRAFRREGYRLQLIAVDNGSTDRTGVVIRELAAVHPEVELHRVEVNQGYGHGMLSGIPLARGPWVGFIPCDGQVAAEDVVRLFEAARGTKGNVVVKARRRFRMDGLIRKVVSVAYQAFVRMLWPRLRTIDVNGTPKLVTRDALLAMRLESTGWLFDPELMIKAHYLGLKVIEHNVFGRMRGGGLSHVRASTCWEFFRVLIGARLTGRWNPRRAGVEPAGRTAAAVSPR